MKSCRSAVRGVAGASPARTFFCFIFFVSSKENEAVQAKRMRKTKKLPTAQHERVPISGSVI